MIPKYIKPGSGLIATTRHQAPGIFQVRGKCISILDTDFFMKLWQNVSSLCLDSDRHSQQHQCPGGSNNYQIYSIDRQLSDICIFQTYKNILSQPCGYQWICSDKEVQEKCLRPDPQLQKISQAQSICLPCPVCFFFGGKPCPAVTGQWEVREAMGWMGRGSSCRSWGLCLGLTTYVLYKMLYIPEGVEMAVQKWLPKIPCILTTVCADEGASCYQYSSCYQYLVLCLCSVSWTVPGHRQPQALPYSCLCCATGSFLPFTVLSSAM